jgi:hypothetical protein
MNSRRLIASPEAQDEAAYQVEPVMSALGQKPTYALQQAMSALHPNSDRESRHQRVYGLAHPHPSLSPQFSLTVFADDPLQRQHKKIKLIERDFSGTVHVVFKQDLAAAGEMRTTATI